MVGVFGVGIAVHFNPKDWDRVLEFLGLFSDSPD